MWTVSNVTIYTYGDSDAEVQNWCKAGETKVPGGYSAT